jgi:hypothetical protein
MQLRNRTSATCKQHSDAIECKHERAVDLLRMMFKCVLQILPPGAVIRFICNVPGDNNGLLFFLASNGRTWSQPQAPCDDEHFQQAACAWETAAANAVGERSWPCCLQPITGHAPVRVVTSNCPGMLQQGTKQSMLGIPHARAPTCTYPCLDPTSTVEDNTNWVMIDLGRHYRCGPRCICFYGVSFKLRRFVPTRYSLRHGNYTASTSLQSWVFEGSTNLLDWIALREHSNDSSLANPFVWASWTILQENQVAGRQHTKANYLLYFLICGFHLAAGA